MSTDTTDSQEPDAQLSLDESTEEIIHPRCEMRCAHCDSDNLSRSYAWHKSVVVGPSYHKWSFICLDCRRAEGGLTHEQLEGHI